MGTDPHNSSTFVEPGIRHFGPFQVHFPIMRLDERLNSRNLTFIQLPFFSNTKSMGTGILKNKILSFPFVPLPLTPTPLRVQPSLGGYALGSQPALNLHISHKLTDRRFNLFFNHLPGCRDQHFWHRVVRPSINPRCLRGLFPCVTSEVILRFICYASNK